MAGMDIAFSSATRDTCVDWAGSLHTKRTVWFTVPTISAVKTPCSAAAAVAVGRLLRLATLRRSFWLGILYPLRGGPGASPRKRSSRAAGLAGGALKHVLMSSWEAQARIAAGCDTGPGYSIAVYGCFGRRCRGAGEACIGGGVEYEWNASGMRVKCKRTRWRAVGSKAIMGDSRLVSDSALSPPPPPMAISAH